MPDTDITLMLAVKSGDTRSFEQLLARHQKSVLNVIYRYVGDAYWAEDLTQEVFLRVYKARESYEPEAKFTTWLYKIVTNLCFKELKKKRKIYSLDHDPNNSDINPGQYIQAPVSDPSEKGARDDLVPVVKQVVENLPANQRMAVVLSKYQGLGYQEIARSMGISAKAVKSLLARARTNIKERLAIYIKNK